MKAARMLWACGLLVASCGQESTSELDFRAASPAYAGLAWNVEKEVLRVCYHDPSRSERHRENTINSVLAWIEPLREEAAVPLAEEVELVGSRDECDVKLTVGNYSPAFTRMGNRPEVFINYSGWFGSQTVTLHEFGHAFGLLDTYVGRGGRCQTGQPDSVMCQAKYEELQEDDINGVRFVYDQIRRGLVTKVADHDFFIVHQ